MRKKPNQYLKGLMEHFRMRRLHPKTYKGRGAGGINDCWKPSAGASKADLIEWHKEDLRLRRRRQLTRTVGWS